MKRIILFLTLLLGIAQLVDAQIMQTSPNKNFNWFLRIKKVGSYWRLEMDSIGNGTGWGAINGGGNASSVPWGAITGSLASQSDLNTALSSKVPTTRQINGYALNTNINLTKADVGLPSVPDVDATVAANINQDATHRFATDAEKTTWNAKISPSDTAGMLFNYRHWGLYPLLGGSYSNPAWITSIAWGKVTGVPSTFTPSAHNHAPSEITQAGATTGQAIVWNGTNWAPGTVSGGGGTANLSLGTRTATTVPVNNSNGSGVTIPAVDATNAGAATADMYNKYLDSYKSYLLRNSYATGMRLLYSPNDSTGVLPKFSFTTPNAKIAIDTSASNDSLKVVQFTIQEANFSGIPNSAITLDATHRFATDAEKTLWNAMVPAGTANRLAYFGSTAQSISVLSAITANRALVSDANGLPTQAVTTAAQIGYLSTTTSDVQAQLNAKVNNTGNENIGGNKTATGQIAYTNQTLTDGATVTFNLNSGVVGTVTLGGNRTLAISNAATGVFFTLIVKQDATGSRTLTLPASSKVAGGGSGAITLTTTANAVDILVGFYDGTNYYWTLNKNFN